MLCLAVTGCGRSDSAAGKGKGGSAKAGLAQPAGGGSAPSAATNAALAAKVPEALLPQEPVVDPLTPDSDPNGVIAASRAFESNVNRLAVETTAVSAAMRRRTAELCRTNAEIRAMVLEAEQLRKSMQGKLASSPGRADAEKEWRIRQAAVQAAEKDVAALKEQMADAQAPDAAQRGTRLTPGQEAELKRDIAAAEGRLEEARKTAVEARAAVAASELEALKRDPQIEPARIQLAALNSNIQSRVAADPQVAALRQRREQLAQERMRAREAGGAPEGGRRR